MAFVSHSTDPNMMTPDQLDKIKDSYAEMIIDGMDMQTLCQFAYDSIIQNIEMWDEVDLREEIIDLYGEELWEEMKDGIG